MQWRWWSFSYDHRVDVILYFSNKKMAKIISLTGWYHNDKTEQIILFNADYITTIEVKEDNQGIFLVINLPIESGFNLRNPIYTRMKLDDLIKMVNG